MSLDPRQNRIKRERKKVAENQVPPLNPPFPFRVVPFNPWSFDLQRDPPVIDTPQPASR
jgi:hypothetical protein